MRELAARLNAAHEALKAVTRGASSWAVVAPHELHSEAAFAFQNNSPHQLLVRVFVVLAPLARPKPFTRGDYGDREG